MTPLGRYRQQMRNWLHQYGSEVPDELFKLAYFTWLEILAMKQPAFERSPVLQQAANQTFQNFAAAKGKWENR